MSFLRKMFGGGSQEFQLPWIPEEQWPGYIASLLEHEIAKCGIHALANAAVYVDKRNNSVGLCREDDGSAPDFSDDPIISVFCRVGDAPFFTDAKKLIESLQPGSNHPTPSAMVVDKLAWSIVGLLEKKRRHGMWAPRLNRPNGRRS
jgi:hypothetical protein